MPTTWQRISPACRKHVRHADDTKAYRQEVTLCPLQIWSQMEARKGVWILEPSSGLAFHQASIRLAHSRLGTTLARTD